MGLRRGGRDLIVFIKLISFAAFAITSLAPEYQV
jgi:hypothetical protein